MDNGDEPPAYEETSPTPGYGDSKADAEVPQHFSIREEVGTSRSQHVAALVARLLPQIRERARRGLSKTTLLLLPSNQDASRKGQLVGYPEDEAPVVIQLEGSQDTIEFWTQREATAELQRQMFAAVADGVPPIREEQPLPERPVPPPARSSFFGRKQSKAPAIPPVVRAVQPSMTVDVVSEEVYFRSETEYGLFETLRGRGVLVSIVVR